MALAVRSSALKRTIPKKSSAATGKEAKIRRSCKVKAQKFIRSRRRCWCCDVFVIFRRGISHQERHAAILVCYVDFFEGEAFSVHARKYVIHVFVCEM